MKKTTFEIYYNLLPIFFSFFLLSANLVSAADKCAVFSNDTVGTSLSKTPVYDGVLLHNCFDKNLFLQKNKATFAQNPLLILGVKTVAMCLFVEIRNLHKVFYYQNSLVFGCDEAIV